MKRSLWLFLLKLLPATLILGWFWFDRFQRSYPDLIQPIAYPVFELLGVTQWHLYLLAEHFTNLVPFVALLIATPGIVRRWQRFLVALIAGLAIIVLLHILMSVAVYFIYKSYAMSEKALRLIVPVYLVNDAMPLVLWLVFFPDVLGEMFSFVKFGRRGGGEAQSQRSDSAPEQPEGEALGSP